VIKSKPDNIGRNNRHKKNQSVNIFDKRSLQYNDLNWVFDPNFAKVIFRFINPLISDILLDLGTGTGQQFSLNTRNYKRQQFKANPKNIFRNDLSFL